MFCIEIAGEEVGSKGFRRIRLYTSTDRERKEWIVALKAAAKASRLVFESDEPQFHGGSILTEEQQVRGYISRNSINNNKITLLCNGSLLSGLQLTGLDPSRAAFAVGLDSEPAHYTQGEAGVRDQEAWLQPQLALPLLWPGVCSSRCQPALVLHCTRNSAGTRVSILRGGK